MKTRFSHLPSIRALVAFESAGRLSNFSRAAEELNTSQSAISRHIADLEARLGTQLFHRERRTVRLTEQGIQFHKAAVSGLETIRESVETVANCPSGDQLTLACTHEVSHLYVLPRFEQLQADIGADVQIRVMTFEYDAFAASLDPRIDVMLSYQPNRFQTDRCVVALREAVRPVCSPDFAEVHADILSGPIPGWERLPFLRVTKKNDGWATWEDWFDTCANRRLEPPYIGFDNYLYLLEAAAAGKGLALGWSGLVDRHLELGSLVCVRDDPVHFDGALFAELTKRGMDQPVAQRCLSFLDAEPA